MKHPVSPAYEVLRLKFPAAEVNLGYTGIALTAIEKIPEAQLGYSIIPEGDTTDWKDSWVVIGHDTSLGDPIFIDVAKKSLPVFTAPHGEGSWSPAMIAPTIESFFEIMTRFAVLAKDRQHPVALEANPLGDEEREEFLDHVSSYFDDDVPVFWEILVSTDL